MTRNGLKCRDSRRGKGERRRREVGERKILTEGGDEIRGGNDGEDYKRVTRLRYGRDRIIFNQLSLVIRQE